MTPPVALPTFNGAFGRYLEALKWVGVPTAMLAVLLLQDMGILPSIAKRNAETLERHVQIQSDSTDKILRALARQNLATCMQMARTPEIQRECLTVFSPAVQP